MFFIFFSSKSGYLVSIDKVEHQPVIVLRTYSIIISEKDVIWRGQKGFTSRFTTGMFLSLIFVLKNGFLFDYFWNRLLVLFCDLSL